MRSPTSVIFVLLAVSLVVGAGVWVGGGRGQSPLSPGAHGTGRGATAVTSNAQPDLEAGINTLVTGAPATELVGDPAIGSFVMTNVPPLGSGLGQGTLKLISGSAYRVVARLSIGAESAPRLATDPENGTVFVSNATGNVTVLSAPSLVPLGTLALAPVVKGLAFDPFSGALIVLEGCEPAYNILTAAVVEVNATTGSVTAQVAMPCSPNGVLVDPLNGNVFVLDGADGNLTVLSGADLAVLNNIANVSPTLIRGIPPGAAMTFDPRDGFVYVRCVTVSSPGCLAVFNGTGAPVALRHFSTEVQGAPVIDGGGNVDFLAWSNSSAGDLEELYSMQPPNGSLSPGLPLGCPNDGLGWNPVNHELYGLAHCGATGRNASLFLFTAAPLGVVTSVPIVNFSFFQFPTSGDSGVVDPVSGLMVAAFPSSTGGSAVGLVGPFPVTFRASIFAPGVEWSVNLSFPSGFATTYSSADPSIRVFLANGSYRFSYAVPFGFSQSRTEGGFTMNGAPVAESVTFSWEWWYWLTLGALGFVLYLGIGLCLKARVDYRVRRASAVAKLRYDLQHRLVEDPDEPHAPR